jgi:hypothetical protein
MHFVETLKFHYVRSCEISRTLVMCYIRRPQILFSDNLCNMLSYINILFVIHTSGWQTYERKCILRCSAWWKSNVHQLVLPSAGKQTSSCILSSFDKRASHQPLPSSSIRDRERSALSHNFTICTSWYSWWLHDLDLILKISTYIHYKCHQNLLLRHYHHKFCTLCPSHVQFTVFLC